MGNNIKIPDQYYMGRREKGLAFITPAGTDQAAESRKTTVNDWARTRPYKWVSDKSRPYKAWNGDTVYPKKRVFTGKDTSTYKTFNNTPQTGFKLCKVVGRWCTANKAFEIEDPRGFRIQIYSNNLVEICQQAGIVDGILQGEYVYGREGANNVLLPIGSEIYTKAKQLTDDIKSPKVSLKKLSVGDQVVILHYGNRYSCLYAGRQYLVQTRSEYRSENVEWFDKIEAPRHLFIAEDEILDPVKPNILSIEKSGAKSATQVQKILQAITGEKIKPFAPSDWYKQWGYHTEPSRIFCYSPDRSELVAMVKAHKEELDTFKPVHVKGARR